MKVCLCSQNTLGPKKERPWTRQGRYLRSEIERICSSVGHLNELANMAHGGTTLEDARTVAIGTYIILGELVQRTDMIPTRFQGLSFVSPRVFCEHKHTFTRALSLWERGI